MISWLIPTYQTPVDYLHASIQSVIVELQPADEIIILDDGSTDRESINCVEHYSELNPKIRLKRVANNLGVAKILNIGLEMVAGDIIARVDADDWNVAGRIKKQLDWWTNQPADLIGGEMMCLYHDHTSHAKPDSGDYLSTLRKFYPICFHPTWLIKTETLANLGGYPTTYPHAEDFALQCQMVREGMTFTNVPEIIVNKRQHKNRVSQKYHNIQTDSAKRALRDILP